MSRHQEYDDRTGGVSTHGPIPLHPASTVGCRLLDAMLTTGVDGGLLARNGFGLAAGSWRHAFEASGQIGAGNDDFFHQLRICGIRPITKVNFAIAVFPAVHLGKSAAARERQCDRERETDPTSSTHIDHR